MTVFSRFVLSGIHPEGGLSRLKKAGITVYGVEKPGKDRLYFSVRRKDAKKAVAIFADSCYNITKRESVGLARVLEFCQNRVGMFLGGVLFLAVMALSRPMVLRIEVYGNGAFYAGEVLEILEECGIAPFLPYSGADAEAEAKILSLPTVSFCSVEKEGYLVRVEVERSEMTPERAEREPLYAECEGVVESVLVLRGRAAVAVGDSVEAGDVLVYAETEAGESVVPVAKVSVRRTVCGTLPEVILWTNGDYRIEAIEGEQYTVSYLVIHTIHF